MFYVFCPKDSDWTMVHGVLTQVAVIFPRGRFASSYAGSPRGGV